MYLPILLLGIAVLSSPVRAEELTEQQALSMLSSTSPRVRALTLQVELARATARTESLYPNPSVTYSREDAGGTSESYFLYQQPLSINGRRQLLRRAAEAIAESTEFTVRMQMHDLRQDLRSAFLEVLFLQEQNRLLGSERDKLVEIVEVLKKREKAGESSGYDCVRAERELSALDAEIHASKTRLDRWRAELASFFDPAPGSDTLAAIGSLALPSLPDLPSLISKALNRADIRAEQKSADYSDRMREAARRKLYPDPILSGGFKSPSINDRRDTGYVLSVTVPLPLFDRGKAEIARAEASKRVAVARAEALSAEVRNKLVGIWHETRARLHAAEEYRKSALSQSEDLIRIARIAYEGGEVGILELLDAYRNHREFLIRMQDFAVGARRSFLEMERIVGEEIRL